MDDENLIKVSFIRHKGQASLVEFYDENNFVDRVFVPSDQVLEESGSYFVSQENLEMGISYGVRFESHLPARFTIKGEDIAHSLRKAGIWTIEDYEKNANTVRAIILDVARDISVSLYSVVKNEKRRRIQ